MNNDFDLYEVECVGGGPWDGERHRYSQAHKLQPITRGRALGAYILTGAYFIESTGTTYTAQWHPAES